jgi:hypothetical protein
MIGNNHHLDPIPGEDFQMFEQDLLTLQRYLSDMEYAELVRKFR